MSIDITKYPKTNNFEIIDTIDIPHLYCITPNHVGHASDNFNGILGSDAIKDLELKQRQGCCGVNGCNLTYQDHKHGLLVQVNSNEPDLNNIPSLNEYLQSCKEQAIIDGVEGFAFKQISID